MEQYVKPQDATAFPPPFSRNLSSGNGHTINEIRGVIERIVDGLNLRYNLELPKDHRRRPNASAKQEQVLARRCSEHIEVLARQQHRVHIPDVIQDFEEWAKPVLMKWVPKQRQESGTIVSQSINAFNRYNSMATAASFTPEQRLHLVVELERRLHEECRLLGDSEVYSRSSSLHKVYSLENKKSSSQPRRPQLSTMNIDKTLKRKKPSSTPDDLAAKRQSPSKNRSTSMMFPLGDPDLNASKESLKAETSFGTTASSVVQAVFSQSNATEVESNVTSFADESNSQSTDLFPSQDALEFEKDEGFRRSFTEACKDDAEPKVKFSYRSLNSAALLESLEDCGPFRQEDPNVWRNIPFRTRYELQRISEGLGVSLKKLLIQINGEQSDLRSLWQSARNFAPGAKTILAGKSSQEAWDNAHGAFRNENNTSSVTLSGSLCWATPPDEGLLKLQLLPLKLEQSCRFHRRFGADRFLTLYLPSLSARLPQNFPNHFEVHSAISTWFARSTHYFLGREWRAFYVEEDKRKTKNLNPGGFKVHLFAVNGFDFTAKDSFPLSSQCSECRSPLKVDDFLDWHLRVHQNVDSTDTKIFQRIALGLSRTCPTVSFEPNEFIHLVDTPGKPVMNDGCARISRSAAVRISEDLGLQSVPSVFQGRIAGAKGVWMVDDDQRFSTMSARGFAIEISDSQLKIHPHPQSIALDVMQRTFEVTEWSRAPRPATLNKQFLSILQAGGVPLHIFETALLEDVHEYYRSLEEAANDLVLLRTWLQTTQRSARSAIGIKYTGAWPDDRCEQAIQFVESGFLPVDCIALQDLLREFLRKYFDYYIEKLAITVPHSTDVYCIADPYGVLAENEIHLGFSENWKASGFSDTIVDEVDVLVARSPAMLPSDIQRRRASWKRELRHFKDVVVFSTIGDIPLASILSGGDYDGDHITVIWDQSFVSNFRNTDLPKDLPSKEDCHVADISRKLSPIVQDADQATIYGEILGSCFSFNLKSNFLGICTNEHERLIYTTGTLFGKGALLLATLAGYLVDRSKQGLLLTKEGWEEVRLKANCKRLKIPAYKNNDLPRDVSTNVIDYLKFSVAVPQKDQRLDDFNQKLSKLAAERPQHRLRDPQLTQWWEKARIVAKREKTEGDSRLDEILTDMMGKVDQVLEDWKKTMPHKTSNTEGRFPKFAQSFSERVANITPCHEDHPMIKSYEWETENSRWSFIRASYLYRQRHLKSLAWYLVGSDLCQMKIKANERSGKGSNRMVDSRIYPSLQVNVKLVRRKKILDEEEPEVEDVGNEEQLYEDNLDDE